jgi:pimeloyl-ACP methyl ester carboxylesterase
LTVALLLLSISALAASDYAREKRWEDEVAPGIVVGDPAYLVQSNGHKFLAIYTEAASASMGVIVVHGIGIHPDWGLIGTLRQRLPDYGYATLAIQMPVLAADARPEAYLATLPEAVERLQLALAYLHDKGYKRVALVSHSMGSRMARAYMAGNPAGINAWAALGVAALPGDPDAAGAYEGVKTPVLDLYGANDLPQVLAGAAKRKAALAGNAASKQIMIPDTNHFFAGHEDDMVKAVKDFLDGLR